MHCSLTQRQKSCAGEKICHCRKPPFVVLKKNHSMRGWFFTFGGLVFVVLFANTSFTLLWQSKYRRFTKHLISTVYTNNKETWFHQQNFKIQNRKHRCQKLARFRFRYCQWKIFFHRSPYILQVHSLEASRVLYWFTVRWSYRVTVDILQARPTPGFFLRYE